MKIKIATTTTLLLILLAFSAFQQLGTAITGIEQPSTIDVRQMTFFNEMKTRIAEYNAKSDWTMKIYPTDTSRLDTVDDSVYIEVYVSDIADTTQLAQDFRTGKTEHIFKVYRASERAIKQLSEIPNNYFYVTKFNPSIGMIVEKQYLQQIANNPSVYCIRVIQKYSSVETLSFPQARTNDDIDYTMQNHDNTLDAATEIAAIDAGYDPNESSLNAVASDNLVTQVDFVDGDNDVSSGLNWHGTNVLDIMAIAFWESYEDGGVFYPLRAGNDRTLSNNLISQAIDWCIQNDMEIVNMSFGSDEGSFCTGLWCDRFRTGTLAGITWVAASGNRERETAVDYPAQSHYVVAAGSYGSINGQGQAVRSDFSDYGTVLYSISYPFFMVSCWTCFTAQGSSEFKPNVYDCGELDYVGAGTSYSAPLVCASIAIGMYSPGNGEYTGGHESLLDVIALSNEISMDPSDAGQQGDVIDTHTLWHRQVETP